MKKQIPEAVSVLRKITYTSASSTSALRYSVFLGYYVSCNSSVRKLYT